MFLHLNIHENEFVSRFAKIKKKSFFQLHDFWAIVLLNWLEGYKIIQIRKI